MCTVRISHKKKLRYIYIGWSREWGQGVYKISRKAVHAGSVELRFETPLFMVL